MSNKLSELKTIFGPSFGRPAANAIELKPPIQIPITEPEQESETVRSQYTGVVLVPGFRFNGSIAAPPWNMPEEEIFEWLSSAPVEMLQEDIFDKTSGVFCGTIRKDSLPKSVLVRFAGIGRQHVISNWGAEYVIDSELDLLSREVASYEVIKAIGGEDLAMPVCIKDLNTVDLISDAVRETVAKELRIQSDKVDETLSVGATVQLMPSDMTNFAEAWGDLGIDNAERWDRASDQLRYSIYRAYFIDFILGTPDRQYSAFGYNVNTDKIIMLDQSASFPHSGFSAEKYSQIRLKGWGRADAGAKYIDSTPPTTYDFHSIFKDLKESHLEEAMLTSAQISERLTDVMAGRIAMSLLEFDVPVECVASLLLRIAYLSFAPGSVLKRPIEFMRNFCVPVRAGMEISDPRIANSVDYVNQIMSAVLGEEYESLETLMQEAPEDVEFLI